VSVDGHPVLLRHRQPQAVVRQAVLPRIDDQVRVAGRATPRVDQREVGGAAEVFVGAEALVHDRHFHRPERGGCGYRRPSSSTRSRPRPSSTRGTPTLISINWSPPPIPFPRKRSREPDDAPGGTFTVTCAPSIVGTSTLVPRAASTRESGTSRMMFLPSRL